MTEATETPTPATDALPSVGERLTQARQSQGLSLGEMARQLKLSVKQVEALERDDYRLFPGPLWVRGFLRNYAKVLGLDGEALVQKAGLAPEAPGEVPHTAMPTTPASAGKERRRVVIMIFAFVVLGLFVLGLLGQRAGRHSDSGASPETPTAATSTESGTSAPVVADPAALPPQDSAATNPESAGAASSPLPAVPAEGAAATPDPGISASPPTAGSPAAAPGATSTTPGPTPAPASVPGVDSPKPDAGARSTAPAVSTSVSTVPGPGGAATPPGAGSPASGSAPSATAVPSTATGTASPAGTPPVPASTGRPATSPTPMPATTQTSAAQQQSNTAPASPAASASPASSGSPVRPAPQGASAGTSAGAAPATPGANAAGSNVATPASTAGGSPSTPPKPSSAPTTASTPAQSSTASSAPASVPTAAVPGAADAAGAAATPPVEEVKPRTVRFTFTQSVDMRVVDANGKVLMGALQAAGSQKSVRGLPPFSVSVGNVHAVEITYRGRVVDLTSRGRSGATKITLK